LRLALKIPTHATHISDRPRSALGQTPISENGLKWAVLERVSQQGPSFSQRPEAILGIVPVPFARRFGEM
jgi:hypothetical protein